MSLFTGDPFRGAQAEGAIENGARIRKWKQEPGDAHEVGAEGVVVSSVGPLPEWEVRRAIGQRMEMPGDQYGYMVKWDDRPELPVFVRGGKIESAE